MENQKNSESIPEKRSQICGTECCSQNHAEMFKKMQEFCCGMEMPEGCSEMMQQMLDKNSQKTEK